MSKLLGWYEGVVDYRDNENVPEEGFYVGRVAGGCITACTSGGKRIAGGSLVRGDGRLASYANPELGFDIDADKQNQLMPHEVERILDLEPKTVG